MADPRLIQQGVDARTRILEFMRMYWSENFCAPTIREIQRSVGYNSPSTVKFHLDTLIKSGMVFQTKRREYAPAGMEVIFHDKT